MMATMTSSNSSITSSSGGGWWDDVVELTWLERYVPWRTAHLWVADHPEVPLLLSVAYLVGVFSIKRAMRDRPAFDLTTPLLAWNVLLAAFSLFGSLATVPHILRVIRSHGVTHDMCTFDSEVRIHVVLMMKKTMTLMMVMVMVMNVRQSVNPWILLFGLSKVPELLDTFFIVLRKRPLIFLHYYHHVLTLLYCWHGLGLQVPNGGWFAAMNLVIHTLMYAYYAACAYGVRFGVATRQSITTLQILQMVLGVGIIVHNLVMCNTHPANYAFGLVMYVSYMVLFVKLYVDSYVVKRDASRRKRSASGSATTATATAAGRKTKKED
jgi:hypothetical protein